MRRSFSFGSREASRVMRDHVRKLRCLLEAGGFAPLRRRRFAVSRDRCGVRSRTGMGWWVFLRMSAQFPENGSRGDAEERRKSGCHPEAAAGVGARSAERRRMAKDL